MQICLWSTLLTLNSSMFVQVAGLAFCLCTTMVHAEHCLISRMPVWGPDITTASQQPISLKLKTSLHTPSTDSGSHQRRLPGIKTWKVARVILSREISMEDAQTWEVQHALGTAGKSYTAVSKATSKTKGNPNSNLHHLYTQIWQ